MFYGRAWLFKKRHDFFSKHGPAGDFQQLVQVGEAGRGKVLFTSRPVIKTSKHEAQKNAAQ